MGPKTPILCKKCFSWWLGQILGALSENSVQCPNTVFKCLIYIYTFPIASFWFFVQWIDISSKKNLAKSQFPDLAEWVGFLTKYQKIDIGLPVYTKWVQRQVCGDLVGLKIHWVIMLLHIFVCVNTLKLQELSPEYDASVGIYFAKERANISLQFLGSRRFAC